MFNAAGWTLAQRRRHHEILQIIFDIENECEIATTAEICRMSVLGSQSIRRALAELMKEGLLQRRREGTGPWIYEFRGPRERERARRRILRGPMGEAA